MLAFIILTSICAVLMFRSGYVEYQYYKSVRTLEPQAWATLGSPRFLNIPVAFVSKKNAVVLNSISNETVRDLARKHRFAGILFLVYVVIILVGCIFYFRVV